MCFDQERLNSFLNIPFKEQGTIFFAPSDWVKKLGGDGLEYFHELPDKALNRPHVRDFCQNPANDVRIGYLYAMAWGNQGAGVTFRHASKAWGRRDDVANRLIKIRDGKLNRMDSYSLFSGVNAIPGLGPSYLTKLLYFFSRDQNHYIMDQWTAKSINFICDDEIIQMSGHYPSANNNGKSYETFCRKVDELVCLAKERGQVNTGEQIEQRLFSKGGHTPEAWRVVIRSAYPKRVLSSKKEQLNGKNIIVNSGRFNEYVNGTTLSRPKNFRWFFDREEKVIHILREFKNQPNPRVDGFSIDEAWDVLELLNNHYGTNGFRLANSVADFRRAQETDGLGAAHYARKNDATRAQAVSQLAAIYCETGIVSVEGNRPIKFMLAKNMNKRSFLDKLLIGIEDGE
jgi:hypothetical protein